MIKNSKVWLILSLTVKFQKLVFSLLNIDTHTRLCIKRFQLFETDFQIGFISMYRKIISILLMLEMQNLIGLFLVAI